MTALRFLQAKKADKTTTTLRHVRRMSAVSSARLLVYPWVTVVVRRSATAGMAPRVLPTQQLRCDGNCCAACIDKMAQ